MPTTTVDTKPPKKASSELKTSAASKKVPSPVRTSAALKKVPLATQASTALKKPTLRKRVGKRVPPAPKSGARPVGPAVLAAAVQSLALPQLPQPAPGQAINLGPIAGTESPTGAFGAGAVDLCEISPSGLVALGGDTFSGNAEGSGAWSPSMALQVQPGTVNGNPIQFSGSFGGNGTLYAEPPPNVPLGSQLPAGTVQVYGIDYAFVTRTANLQPQQPGVGDRSRVLPGRRKLAERQRNADQRLPGSRRQCVHRRRRVRPRPQRVALPRPCGEVHGPKSMVGLGNRGRRQLGLERGPDTS